MVSADRASVLLFDEAAAVFRYLAVVPEDAVGPKAGDTIPVADFPPLSVIAQPGLRATPDIAGEESPAPIVVRAAGAGLRSAITTSLLAHGSFVGLLSLSSSSPREFNSAAGEALREVADQLAVAIQQARLREDLELHTSSLERAMSQLRTKKRVVVLHYSPIAETVQGEATEIFPFMGTSRLAEVVDRHGADLVVHGHAHHGVPEGHTSTGVPVYNVALPLLRRRFPDRPPFRVVEVPVADDVPNGAPLAGSGDAAAARSVGP